MEKTYGKLRGKIVEVYGSQREFAKAVEQTEQTVTAKLNGRSEFSQSDIIKWCNTLRIMPEDIANYFFGS